MFGENSLREAMTEQGFVLADEDVAAVVASIDWGVTFEKIKRACLLIRRGARFYATNLDPTRPTEEGLVPGTGALIAAIATGAETQPTPSANPSRPCSSWRWHRWAPAPETTATSGRPD